MVPAAVIAGDNFFSCFCPSFVFHLAVILNLLPSRAVQSKSPPLSPTVLTTTVVSFCCGALLGALLTDWVVTVFLSGSLKVNTSLSPTFLPTISLLSTVFVSSAAIRLAGLTIEKSMNIDKIIERILFDLSMFNSFLI